MQYINNYSRNGVKNQVKKQPPSRSRNKSGSPSYNRSSNRYDSRNRRPSDRGTKELHTTTCSKCKKETQVPFKPTGIRPVYCRECFQDQKPKNGSADIRRSPGRSMSRQNYRSSTRSSGRYEDRSRNRTDRKSTELHTVICSKCKKETQVPFKPTGIRPVYCRECFQDQKPKDGSEDKRRSPGRSMSRPNYQSSTRSSGRDEDRSRNRTNRKSIELHTVICSKCKKETQVPFKPTRSKPVYCRECFQDQKPKGEPAQVTEGIEDNKDEVVERFGNRTGPYRANKRMHSTTCKTCNKEIMIPFKPKESKPTYCQDCFQKVGKKK